VTRKPPAVRVPVDEIILRLREVLVRNGFAEPACSQLAEVFAHNSRDGVGSHGLDRFPEFIASVHRGWVDPRATAICEEQIGPSWERWNGRRAAGPLSALTCIDRATELASATGLGVVALRETNHWMRAGTYGARAAMRGYAAVCFTNTAANTTPWGGSAPKIGNNPLVIAIPKGTDPVVLDMAMTQY
jgi:3-dehydro-L-gulonate 2-dehydrogenase